MEGAGSAFPDKSNLRSRVRKDRGEGVTKTEGEGEEEGDGAGNEDDLGEEMEFGVAGAG